MRQLKLFAILSFLAATVAPLSLAAQQSDPQEEFDPASIEVLGDDLWLSSTTSSSTTLAVAVGVFSVELATARTPHLVAFIRHNGLSIQHDLHLGGGDTLRDLGAMFGVPGDEAESFSRRLYQKRDRLVPLADPGRIDAERSHQFASIVLEALAVPAEEINSPVPSVVSSDSVIGELPHRAEDAR